jgi:hypothetical protein
MQTPALNRPPTPTPFPAGERGRGAGRQPPAPFANPRKGSAES